MVKLVKTPKGYDTLNGLLSLFKNKLSNCGMYTHLPVDVSIRFTYLLNDWSFFEFTNSINATTLDIDHINIKFGEIPLGAIEEPISEFRLMVSWPRLAEDVINDSIAHSDLVPANAPEWCVTVKYVQGPYCYLENFLGEFETVLCRRMSLDLVLGSILKDEIDPSLANFMDRLAEPRVKIPDLTTPLIPQAEREKKKKLNDDEVLMKFMNYVFIPPVLEEEVSYNNTGCIDFGDISKAFEAESTHKQQEQDEVARLKDRLKSLKTTTKNSIVWRLSLAVIEAYHSYGGIEGLAQLWVKVVAELRHHFERGYVIASIDPGAPNLAMSLLHQKIQMLNCCIETKNARDALNQGMTTSINSMPRTACSSDDEDFYECSESTTTSLGSPNEEESPRTGTASPIIDTEAEITIPNGEVQTRDVPVKAGEGRLKPFGQLKLLGADEQMYIPITQHPSPMTEDMLQEHADALLKLASQPDCGKLTARLQSASLFSDIEAFKAANPGCSLADFVRWFSPRDWNEAVKDSESDEVLKEGELSPRMTIPGNMWQDLWDQARAVPAARQRRLFDDTKEAEKILHELLTMTPADIANVVFPAIIHASLERICEDVRKGPRDMIPFMEQLIDKAKRELRNKYANYKDLIRLIYEAEIGISRAESLRQKLCKKETNGEGGSSLKRFLAMKSQDSSTTSVEELVLDLLDKPEVEIAGAAGSSVGIAITNLFENAQKAKMDDPTLSPSRNSRRLPTSQQFPPPVGREFILRTKLSRPSDNSRPSAHRVYAVITGNEFRLAGAFTEDMLFY